MGSQLHVRFGLTTFLNAKPGGGGGGVQINTHKGSHPGACCDTILARRYLPSGGHTLLQG